MTYRRFAFAALLLLAGCDYLPDQLHDQAKSVRKQIDAIDTRIADYKGDLNSFLSRDGAGGCMSGAQASSFRSTLQEARAAVGQATRLDVDALQPLLEDNDGESEPKVRTLIQRMQQHAGTARRTLEDLRERVVTVRDVQANPVTYRERVDKLAEAVAENAAEAGTILEQTRADFPGRRGELETRAKMRELLTAGQRAHKMDERSGPSDGDATEDSAFNCATVADDWRALRALDRNTPETLKTVRANFAALYDAEERVLVDQKAVYSVQVGRSSWDWSGGRDVNMTFEPTHVPAATYQYIVDLDPDSRLAFKDKNWSEVRPEIPAEHWRHLAPKTPLTNWPQPDHDEASFWVNDWNWNHFHKYRIITGDGERVTDWISVDADVYDRYTDAMGMTIASKPIGTFPDEAMTTPAPPGMNLVGDERYGGWRETPPEGQEVAQGSGPNPLFWYFVGRWSSFNTPYGDSRYAYSRTSHNTYRSEFAGKKPYYGRTTAAGAKPFGTKGTLTRKASGFKTSTFARTGGMKTNYVPASVRGAGPAGRGGGPGGGGK